MEMIRQKKYIPFIFLEDSLDLSFEMRQAYSRELCVQNTLFGPLRNASTNLDPQLTPRDTLRSKHTKV